jgi:hypothetical protein
MDTGSLDFFLKRLRQEFGRRRLGGLENLLAYGGPADELNGQDG